MEHDAAAKADGSAEESTQRPRRRGRPTDPGLERRVFDATRRHLATSGYARMTLAQVAADAGVTRPTLYKRWPSKAELVTAALQYSMVSEKIQAQRVHEMPARDAIRASLRAMTDVVATPQGLGLIGSVLVEDRHTPGLFDLVRQHIVEPGHAQLVAVLQRAQRDGVLRPDLDIDTLVAMLYGAVFVVYVRLGTVDDSLADRALAALWPAVANEPE